MNDPSKMAYLRVGNVEVLAARPTSCGVTVARLRSAVAGHGASDPHPHEAAFMMSLQLQNYGGDLWLNGRPIQLSPFRRGEFSLYDYRENWRANLITPFDCINFHIPIRSFTYLAPDLGLIDTLAVAAGASIADPTVHSLTMSLLPALASPHEASGLFVDHVELALLAHLAVAYGKASVSRRLEKGGLTPLQLRLVTERIDAGQPESSSLSELVSICNLSIGYFSRAFKRTVGQTPHQWQLGRRIHLAQRLLKQHHLSLVDVAIACGFADQAHFNRVFVRLVGVTPGRWRKDRLH